MDLLSLLAPRRELSDDEIMRRCEAAMAGADPLLSTTSSEESRLFCAGSSFSSAEKRMEWAGRVCAQGTLEGWGDRVEAIPEQVQL